MRIDRTMNGDLLLDAVEVSARFGVSPETFRRYLKLGFVKSKVEVGIGDDEGKIRATITLGNRRWIVVTDQDRRVTYAEMLYPSRR